MFGMKLHMLSGSAGTGLVMVGYIAQVARMARTHRVEGVSAKDNLVWALASTLLLIHAVHMESLIFMVLMISQIVCCVLIAAMATIYRSGAENWAQTWAHKLSFRRLKTL